MDNAKRIRRLSARLNVVVTALLALVPLAVLLYWVFYNDLPPDWIFLKSVAAGALELALGGRLPASPMCRTLGFFVTLIPTGVGLYGLLGLRRLFALYRAGRVFEPANVACYRRIGRAALFWAGAVFLQTPLLSLALSLDAPKGQRHLTVGIGTTELTALFLGGVVLLIAWVMDEARGLEEDRSLTI